MKYRDSDKSIKDIAGELGVETILEGSVRRSGDRIRIVSQLIDAKDDVHLWSKTYDKNLADIFDIQSEVAQEIAAALRVRLSESEKARIEKKYSQNSEAYTYYLQGRDYYLRFTGEANQKAISFYKMAIESDSVYALAYAALGGAYAQNFRIYGLGEVWADSSKIMCEKAIELNPDLPEPYTSLGLYYYYNGKFNIALKFFLKAVDIDPDLNAQISIGQIYASKGLFDEAIPWLERGIRTVPTDWMGYYTLGAIMARLGNLEEAEKLFFKVKEIISPELIGYVFEELTLLYISAGLTAKADSMLVEELNEQKDDPTILFCIATIKLFEGKFKDSKPYFEKVFEISSNQLYPPVELSFLLFIEENRRQARKILDSIIKNDEEEIRKGVENPTYHYNLARCYSIIQDKSKSLYYLKEAINLGWRSHIYTMRDPLLENIRNEPE